MAARWLSSLLYGTGSLLRRSCCAIAVAFSPAASGLAAHLQPRICSYENSWRCFRSVRLNHEEPTIPRGG